MPSLPRHPPAQPRLRLRPGPCPPVAREVGGHLHRIQARPLMLQPRRPAVLEARLLLWPMEARQSIPGVVADGLLQAHLDLRLHLILNLRSTPATTAAFL